MRAALPIRARLTLWYLALLALTVTALGAFLLVRLRTDLVAGIDQGLQIRAAQIALGYRGGGEGEFVDVSTSSPVGVVRGESAAQLVGRDGRVQESAGDAVAQRPMVDASQVAQALQEGRVRAILTVRQEGERFRLLVVPASDARSGQVIVLAASLEEVEASVRRLLVLLLLGVPTALAVAGGGGWWLTGKALQPLARMTDRAARIGVECLDERVPVPRTTDELATLATTLNAMLDRLQAGVAQKHRLVADASHELRTPLAIMRSELDVGLGSPDLTPDARAALESVLEEVDSMSRTVANLLTLARIDEGGLPLLRARVDLPELVETVVSDLRPLASTKGVVLTVTDDVGAGEFEGDRDRLLQALRNLVENAVKYSPAGAEVMLSIWRSSDRIGVTILDHGPGIARDAIPRVFDRFFRADPTHPQGEGGAGLGLAIAQAIVLAHGGRIRVESAPERGSAFSIELPVPAGRVTLDRLARS